jgi:hypothetical protein|tara:strand:- start:43 stop:669 length:627 start_codon:yes stop_codon:yes gene_type:complete
MLFPTIVIDNFFDDPEMVLKHAETFDYKFPIDGAYPGARSDNVDLKFFQFTTKKMMAALYPMNYRSMTWSGDQYFQKINGKDYPEEGWVHQDWTSEITAIVYLSKDLGCGTAICTPTSYDKEIIFGDKKQNQYKEMKSNIYYLKKNNDRYEKTIKVDSVFNRLVMFDSHSYHNVISFGDKERLTLVTFLTSINSEKPIKYSLSEMKRT